MVYLSVCAIYKDEGPYLREWLEFHRLVGAERFFLYNNNSTDDHREVLAPLIEEGVVSVKDWPPPGVPQSGAQWAAYDDCLAERRDESRWIAFIDLDEFLFSPTQQPVSEVLRDYEAWPGVGVYRLRFGTSGHRTRPPGLVIENYTRRGRRGPYLVKSVVDPRRSARCLSVHVFEHPGGCAVDEQERPLIRREGVTDPDPQAVAFTASFSTKRLCINHYLTRSEEEFRRKVARPKGDPPDRPDFEMPVEKVMENADLVDDDTILSYAPALRQVLGD